MTKKYFAVCKSIDNESFTVVCKSNPPRGVVTVNHVQSMVVCDVFAFDASVEQKIWAAIAAVLPATHDAAVDVPMACLETVLVAMQSAVSDYTHRTVNKAALEAKQNETAFQLKNLQVIFTPCNTKRVVVYDFRD